MEESKHVVSMPDGYWLAIMHYIEMYDTEYEGWAEGINPESICQEIERQTKLKRR